MMKSNHYLRSITLCLVAATVVLAPPSTVFAASSKPAKTPPSIEETCKQKISKINYRSALLGIYKKSENDKHNAFHKKWATRINYAGQWVPKDAKKTRDSLYKYDALHAATEKEITKQIQDYRYLESSPLDCSKENTAAVVSKLDEIRGTKGKKVVGGQALIAKNKNKERDFLKKDFNKSSEKMIKKLHKAKSKHPKPQHPRTDVKL